VRPGYPAPPNPARHSERSGPVFSCARCLRAGPRREESLFSSSEDRRPIPRFLRDESLPILSAARAEHSLSVAPGFAPVCGDSPCFLRGDPGISQKPQPLKNETKWVRHPTQKPGPPAEPEHFNARWQFSELHLIRTLVVRILIARFPFSIAFRAPTQFRPPSFVFDVSTTAPPPLTFCAPAHS
jgi:hypothetical protein